MGNGASFKEPQTPAPAVRLKDSQSAPTLRNNTKPKNGLKKARKSVIVSLSDAQKQGILFNPELTKQTIKEQPEDDSAHKDSVFKVEIPQGVKPGGTFAALVGGLVISVEVPDFCYPGDFLEIDLDDPLSDMSPGAQNLESDPTSIDITKEAAIMFVKYDLDKTEHITERALRKMLVEEPSISLGERSKELETEIKLAEFQPEKDDPGLTFDEFRFFYSQLKIRVELYKYEKELRHESVMKEVEGKKAELHSQLNSAMKEKEMKFERLRNEFAQRERDYESVIEKLKRERELVKLRKMTLSQGSLTFLKLQRQENRSLVKQHSMEKEKEEHKILVDQILSDFEALLDEDSDDEADMSPKQATITPSESCTLEIEVRDALADVISKVETTSGAK